MLTLKDLANQTGLSENIIRKHIRRLGISLQPYIKRGPNNKLLFDSKGLDIFVEIRNLKNEGKTANEIASYIKKKYGPGDSGVKTDQSMPFGRAFYKRFLIEQDRRVHERDERDLKIVRLELENNRLQEYLKQHAGNNPPTASQKEWLLTQRKKQKTATEVIAVLKKLSCFRFRERKKLLSELTDLVA